MKMIQPSVLTKPPSLDRNWVKMSICVSFGYLCSSSEEHILHIFYAENVTGVQSVVRWDASVRK
jgi:hypothetical protein